MCAVNHPDSVKSYRQDKNIQSVYIYIIKRKKSVYVSNASSLFAVRCI